MTNLGKRPSRREGRRKGRGGWGREGEEGRGEGQASTLASNSTHTHKSMPNACSSLPGGRLSVIIGFVLSPKDCTVKQHASTWHTMCSSGEGHHATAPDTTVHRTTDHTLRLWGTGDVDYRHTCMVQQWLTQIRTRKADQIPCNEGCDIEAPVHMDVVLCRFDVKASLI